MAKAIPKKTSPPIPDWAVPIEKIIEKKYPDQRERARELLVLPELDEAKKILDAAWRRNRRIAEPYPPALFAEAVMLCAFYGVPRKPLELPLWMTDRKEAAGLAENARKLVKVAEQLAEHLGGNGSNFVVGIRKERVSELREDHPNRKILEDNFVDPSTELKPLADDRGIAEIRKIVAAVRFLACYLEQLAATPRKEGAREDLAARNLLCGLEDRFRADVGKPCHPVIALLWTATDGKEKTAVLVKTTILRYRKR